VKENKLRSTPQERSAETPDLKRL